MVRTVAGDASTVELPILHREEPLPAEASALTRAIIGLGSLVLLAVGVLALGVPGIGGTSLILFCVFGVGTAPWQFHVGLKLPARLALSGLTMLAAWTFGATFMLTAHLWVPQVAFFLVTALAVGAHLWALRTTLRSAYDTVTVAIRFRPRHDNWFVELVREDPATRGVVLAVTGGVLCLFAAATHPHLEPGFFGFLTSIGPFWYAGLALILTAIVFARRANESVLAIAVVLLMLVFTLTPALVYDAPHAQSAAKHVTLLQQIRTVHKLQSTVDVYNAWPGFFAATAWMCDVAGIRDPLVLAAFWPPLLGIFRVASLRYFFGQVCQSPYQAWIGTTLAVLADPLGTDYFSPQSVGFVTGLVTLGLALSSRRTALRLVLIGVGGGVLAMSHQLSPYAVGGALCLLVVFRQIRPWWTPALVLVPAAAWALIHQDALRGFVSFRGIGFFANFHPPITHTSPGLTRLPVVAATVYALLLGIAIIGVGALIALIRRRNRARAWAIASAPAVGMVLVAINPYGNEGIFRAILFGIPYLAVLAGWTITGMRGRFARPVLGAVVVAMTTTFLIAAFGLDASSTMRRGDVAAFTYFEADGAAHPTRDTLLLRLGDGDLPSSTRSRADLAREVDRDVDLHHPITQEHNFNPDRFTIALTRLYVESVDDASNTAYYAIWSPTQSNFMWAYGIETPDQFAALRDAFRRSKYWQVILAQDGTYLFKLKAAQFVAEDPR